MQPRKQKDKPNEAKQALVKTALNMLNAGLKEIDGDDETKNIILIVDDPKDKSGSFLASTMDFTDAIRKLITVLVSSVPVNDFTDFLENELVDIKKNMEKEKKNDNE